MLHSRRPQKKIITINGKQDQVTVVKNNSHTYAIVVRKTTYTLTIIAVDRLNNIVRFAINGVIYQGIITSHTIDQYTVFISNFGITFDVCLFDQETATQATHFLPGRSVDAWHPSQQQTMPAMPSPCPPKDLQSPLGGRVIKIYVSPGQAVRAGQPMVAIESMKMENEICSPSDVFVKTILIEPGNLVQQNQVLVTFEMKGEADGSAKSWVESEALQDR